MITIKELKEIAISAGARYKIRPFLSLSDSELKKLALFCKKMGLNLTKKDAVLCGIDVEKGLLSTKLSTSYVFTLDCFYAYFANTDEKVVCHYSDISRVEVGTGLIANLIIYMKNGKKYDNFLAERDGCAYIINEVIKRLEAPDNTATTPDNKEVAQVDRQEVKSEAVKEITPGIKYEDVKEIVPGIKYEDVNDMDTHIVTSSDNLLEFKHTLLFASDLEDDSLPKRQATVYINTDYHKKAVFVVSFKALPRDYECNYRVCIIDPDGNVFYDKTDYVQLLAGKQSIKSVVELMKEYDWEPFPGEYVAQFFVNGNQFATYNFAINCLSADLVKLSRHHIRYDGQKESKEIKEVFVTQLEKGMSVQYGKRPFDVNQLKLKNIESVAYNIVTKYREKEKTLHVSYKVNDPFGNPLYQFEDDFTVTPKNRIIALSHRVNFDNGRIIPAGRYETKIYIDGVCINYVEWGVAEIDTIVKKTLYERHRLSKEFEATVLADYCAKADLLYTDADRLHSPKELIADIVNACKNDDDIRLILGRAMRLVREGEYDYAAKAYKRAYNLGDKQARYYEALVLIGYKHDMVQGLEALYHASYYSEDAAMLGGRIFSEGALGYRDLAKAIDYFRKVERPEIQYLCGQLCLEAGKRYDAEKYFEEAAGSKYKDAKEILEELLERDRIENEVYEEYKEKLKEQRQAAFEKQLEKEKYEKDLRDKIFLNELNTLGGESMETLEAKKIISAIDLEAYNAKREQFIKESVDKL